MVVCTKAESLFTEIRLLPAESLWQPLNVLAPVRTALGFTSNAETTQASEQV